MPKVSAKNFTSETFVILIRVRINFSLSVKMQSTLNVYPFSILFLFWNDVLVFSYQKWISLAFGFKKFQHQINFRPGKTCTWITVLRTRHWVHEVCPLLCIFPFILRICIYFCCISICIWALAGDNGASSKSMFSTNDSSWKATFLPLFLVSFSSSSVMLFLGAGLWG